MTINEYLEVSKQIGERRKTLYSEMEIADSVRFAEIQREFCKLDKQYAKIHHAFVRANPSSVVLSVFNCRR